MRLKLEDGSSVRARKKLIRRGIVERKCLEIDLRAAIGGDEFHGVRKNCERGQAEKIHLQQPKPLEPFHVVLRGNFLAIRFV